MKIHLAIYVFASTFAITLCSCSNDTNNSQNADSVNVDTSKTIPDTTKEAVTKYEIIRPPNGGNGVFDFIYVVYVPNKINHAQTQWIFDDIVKKYPATQIDIDIWNSKKAFFEELKIYQQEDKRYNEGKSIRGFLESKRYILNPDDKHNIATYTNHGDGNIFASYPEDKKE